MFRREIEFVVFTVRERRMVDLKGSHLLFIAPMAAE